MKAMLKLNLQRFAEMVVVDDQNDNTPGDPAPMPEPTPKVSNMPSSVAPEAWRNVEEMLVTLSNNIRVQVQALTDRIEKLEAQSMETLQAVQDGIAELKSTMAEFKQLLADATVEVPEDEYKQNEKQKEEKKRSGGWLSRR